MKRFLLILICLLPLSLLAENPIDDDCTFNGIPLYGKVYIYTSSTGFEDFRVAIDSSGFEDLRVLKQHCCADECGEWQFVASPAFADFTIAILDNSAFVDFVISYSSFSGLNK